MNIVLRPAMDNLFLGVFYVWKAQNQEKLKSYFAELCAIPLDGCESVRYEVWVACQYEIEQAREAQDHVYF